MRRLPAVFIALSLIPSALYGVSTRVQDFSSVNTSNLNQTQVRGQGTAARLELLFQFQTPSNIVNTPRYISPAKIAYDKAHNKVILFGGQGGASPSGTDILNATWSYDPEAPAEGWAQLLPSTVPAARAWHGMAACPSGEIVMFGGYSAPTHLDDTLIGSYNAGIFQWQQVNCSTYPAGRQEFSMTADTTTKVVLFGGRIDSSRLADTWIFDVAQATWTQSKAVGGPSAREGAAMAFNSVDGKFYLFGGNETGLPAGVKQDLWTYSVADDSWSAVNQGTPPPARENAGMYFDSRHSNIVLWGGFPYEENANIWNFDGLWYSGIPVSTPVARQNHGMAYMPTIDKVFIYGGDSAAGGKLDSSLYYVYRSTGEYTPGESYIDAFFDSPALKWLKLEMDDDRPTGTNVQAQVATSPNNTTYLFTGREGTADPNKKYDSIINGEIFDLSPSSCTGRYFKKILYLSATGNNKHTPSITNITHTYNYAPGAPALSTPLNGGATNYTHPRLTWNSAADHDSIGVFKDTITYHVQLDTVETFDSPMLISSAVIPATSYRVLASTVEHGAWYWRARANDGTVDGDWSNLNYFYVDTAAPGAITGFTASTGTVNGQIRLSWIVPADVAPAGLTNNYYSYIVRHASYPITSEDIFNASTTGQTLGTITSPVPGTRVSVFSSGLADGTTYYFGVKLADYAGNPTVLAATSPFACTNSSPTVSIGVPVSSTETWTGNSLISWTASDPDPGDSLRFSIYASNNSGASYTILVASGLANGTTEYLWNTLRTVIGDQYSLKVTAIDARGLSDSATSQIFTVTNSSYPPVVTITAPADAIVASGVITLTWNVSDPNVSDTHTYDIYISSDSGTSFNWHFNVFQTSYQLDTRLYPNGPNYQILARATDPGGLSGQDTVSFKIDNSNLAPREFSLLSPLNNSARSPLSLDFSWENNGDPNPEDALTYTLYFSTNPLFHNPIMISGITSNSYTLNPSALQVETAYYWKVVARDPLGLLKECRQSFWALILSRTKADSADGRIRLEISSGLPENGYIKIERYNTAGDRAIQAADADTIADRHIKTIGDNTYIIAICDASGNVLQTPSKARAEAAPGKTIDIAAVISYNDADGDGYFDGTTVPAENLRAAMLNETARRWELVAAAPLLSKTDKTLTMRLAGTGIITLAGALAPASKISSLVNFPNPFKAGTEVTRIKYVLTEDTEVTASVYSLLGNLVSKKSFARGSEGGKGQATGLSNEISWDGKNDNGELVANGMYILEIRADSEKQIRKIGVIK